MITLKELEAEIRLYPYISANVLTELGFEVKTPIEIEVLK